MPDPADLAHIREEEFRAMALARPRCYSGPPPRIIMGELCCHDCWEPIPADRLAAVAGVGLCTECQKDRERAA